MEDYINFLSNHFSLNENGEIINYFYRMDSDVEESFNEILISTGCVETLSENVKLLVLGENYGTN
mgnify:CR=1 FL=1